MTTPTAALKLARDALARPIAWLCELMQEDGSVKQMIVTEDPDGLRFNDIGEPSPFKVTPLYAAINALSASVPNATPPAWARPLQPAAADVAPLPMMFPPPDGEEASVPSGEPAVRCELVESCRKCRHSVGRQSCALTGRDFIDAGIPDWCPLPVYRVTAQAAPAPAAAPMAFATHHDEPMLFPTAAEAGQYCADDERPIPLCRCASAAPAAAPPEPLHVAAQAVLDHWNSPRWEWAKQGPTADIMQALADALPPATQEPQQ